MDASPRSFVMGYHTPPPLIHKPLPKTAKRAGLTCRTVMEKLSRVALGCYVRQGYTVTVKLWATKIILKSRSNTAQCLRHVRFFCYHTHTPSTPPIASRSPCLPRNLWSAYETRTERCIETHSISICSKSWCGV